MISDEQIDRARNEHETAEPLRVDNDTAAAAWLKGYADGYHGRDLATPRRHVANYLRGYIHGMKARRE